MARIVSFDNPKSSNLISCTSPFSPLQKKTSGPLCYALRD